ncbi:MAG: acyl-[ACP]--phospholipid O-acyltransferase [Rickettsiaceae bacterium]|nr:acyl-[ACP]--phospholipid O-acyltransferase [Rickettsiaceae bacterium]
MESENSHSHRTALIRDRRLWPMLVTQAFTCFNDSAIKSSVVMLVTFTNVFNTTTSSQILVALASMLLMLPFILFAGISGQIADKYEKSRTVQIIKFIEIFIVLLSIYGFIAKDLTILFITIGLMGTHSAFFTPIKYSLIAEHLEKDELIAGNGYIESSTFLGILLGILAGGFAVYSSSLICILMLLISVASFFSSMAILPSNITSSDVKLKFNMISENIEIVKYATTKQQPFLAIMGISWFWFFTGAFMTQIPGLTKEIFWADHYVANFFSAIFSVGVGIGSSLCHKIFGNQVQTRYVFISSILISIIGLDLFFASRISESLVSSEELRTLTVFMSKKYNWRIVIDFLLLSFLAGLYIVPLYAVLQSLSHPNYRSRMIAANNLINSAFMILSNVLIYLLVYAGCSVTTVLFIIFFLHGIISFYIYQMIPENTLIPESWIKYTFKFILDLLYRVEVRGLENFEKAGKRVLIVANHPSYLEPPLLAIYLPEKPIFAIRTRVSEYWWVKPLRRLVKTYPIDTSNSMAIKNIIGELQKNKKIVIFPEGRRSTTGSLMKIYDGPGMIADKVDATILPIRIDGTQFCSSARARHETKNYFFPKITITILPPVKMDAPSDMEGIERRKYLRNRLYDVMSDMMFESSDYKQNIFLSVLSASKIYGKNFAVMRELDNPPMSYKDLISRSIVLGGLLSQQTKEKENVGLMLPTSCGAVFTFYALQAYNRIPAMINFTSGAGSISSACTTAKVSTIITSRLFVEKAELVDVARKLSEEFNIIYLEDVRSKITYFDKLRGLFAIYFPYMTYNSLGISKTHENDLATILFTSGTEGAPKAVALSHKNILANTFQMNARIDFHTTDLVFNALPIFHSFGLMAGCIMPITAGVKVFFYPSPLHYRFIPEIVYDNDATILLGTDTFFKGYARYADPYDFYSVRYAFVGAERLNEETRRAWFDKFGVRIFEGYGITEGSPVVAVNTPMHNMAGSVGRLLPKIEYKLLPLEGLDNGYRLYLKGPNIMLGYMFNDNPGVINPPFVDGLGQGWHDTGDIVTIDDEGYLTIKGRAKRFAKIAGEMVSLTMVEDVAAKIDSAHPHAAIHILDEEKGEHIILFTESNKITREAFVESVAKFGYSNLLVPKVIHFIKEIPLLATGKTNYRNLLEIGQTILSGVKE